MLACYLGVRLYFFLGIWVGNHITGSAYKIIYRYLLFGIFVVLEIPFAIFFPAWAFNKFKIVEYTPTTTMSFILFGCLVLSISVWKGNVYRKKHRWSEHSRRRME